MLPTDDARLHHIYSKKFLEMKLLQINAVDVSFFFFFFFFLLLQMSDKENEHSNEMQNLKGGYLRMLQQVNATES